MSEFCLLQGGARRQVLGQARTDGGWGPATDELDLSDRRRELPVASRTESMQAARHAVLIAPYGDVKPHMALFTKIVSLINKIVL